MIGAIDEGFPQKEIAAAAYRFQQQLDRKEKVIVGVNKYTDDDEHDLPILKIDQEKEDEQVAFVKKVKAKRNKDRVGMALRKIADDAKANRNLVPSILEAVKAYASVGEICDVFREVYGIYRDPANY
jgi:methylmalonyl-CoA mutase N-terminal domain/subunit